MVGKRGEGGDLTTTASVKKRDVLVKMLLEEYIAVDDVEQSRSLLPRAWASRVQTLENIPRQGRVGDDNSSQRRHVAHKGSRGQGRDFDGSRSRASELWGPVRHEHQGVVHAKHHDAGGSSLYHAAMLRRKEADDHAAKLFVSPALSVGDIVACRAGQRTIHSLEESGRVAIKLAASGGLVTYNSRGKK